MMQMKQKIILANITSNGDLKNNRLFYTLLSIELDNES